MDRQHISSGRPTEEQAGYSRAVRVGNLVYIAGTTALDEQGVVAASGDMYGQSRRALQTIEAALREAGASLADVVRTRIFVTDMERGHEAMRAHREAFHNVRPAATLVEITRLAHPEMLVEIEADAVISG